VRGLAPTTLAGRDIDLSSRSTIHNTIHPMFYPSATDKRVRRRAITVSVESSISSRSICIAEALQSLKYHAPVLPDVVGTPGATYPRNQLDTLYGSVLYLLAKNYGGRAT
jgi:hypothetical protein